jgi:hypothetical protein
MMNRYTPIKFFWFILCGAILALVAACSSDDDPGPGQGTGYYIRFKVSGTQKEYKANPVAQVYFDEDNLAYRCNIVGSGNIVSTHDVMTLFMVSKEPFKKDVQYVLQTEVEMASNGSQMPQVAAVYIDENKKGYTAQFLPADWFDFDDHAEAKFTEMTDKHIKGTFSARVFTSIPDREELLITDGEFYVPVIKVD